MIGPRRKKTYPLDDQLTDHHVYPKVRGGKRAPENLLRLRAARHRLYHLVFGERCFSEAAEIIDALGRAYALRHTVVRALAECDRRKMGIRFEHGSRNVLCCMAFWEAKRGLYQQLFRRDEPSVRDAEVLRRALRMLHRRLPKEVRQFYVPQRRRSFGELLAEALAS